MENRSKIKGKIVLVPFPFDDLTTSKVRPAVCLTNSIGQHRHVVLAFITSQIPSNILESDIIVETSHKDFKTTGLQVSSTIRLHRTLTVTTSIIKRELGKLSQDLLNEVNKKLKLLFEL